MCGMEVNDFRGHFIVFKRSQEGAGGALGALLVDFNYRFLINRKDTYRSLALGYILETRPVK